MASRAPYTAGLTHTSKTAKSQKGDTDVIDPFLIGTCMGLRSPELYTILLKTHTKITLKL